MPRKFDVALLVHTATAWGHQILEGVARYAKKQNRWRILYEPGRGVRDPLRMQEDWKVDGILARLDDPFLVEHVLECGVPIVNMSSVCFDESSALPRVCEDVAGMGMMAARHFADLGFKNFAYYGSFQNGFYTSLRDAFEQSVRERRGSFFCHPSMEQRPGARKKCRDTQGLKEWLDALPKPVGILTWKSHSATELSSACRELKLLIPDQVSILIVGAPNNPAYEILDPPISNVAVDAAEIGYQAARLLDTLMEQRLHDGEAARSKTDAKKPAESLLIPAVGIEMRTSTNTLAIGNEHVARAVAYIRDHAFEPITVADVLNHISISRPRIETLFRQHLDRSPAEEIRRIRLDRAEKLLRETNLSIPEVAEASGFTSPEYLARVFKTIKGVTPLRYRKGN